MVAEFSKISQNFAEFRRTSQNNLRKYIGNINTHTERIHMFSCEIYRQNLHLHPVDKVWVSIVIKNSLLDLTGTFKFFVPQTTQIPCAVADFEIHEMCFMDYLEIEMTCANTTSSKMSSVKLNEEGT